MSQPFRTQCIAYECRKVCVDVLSDDGTVALDDVTHLSLFEGKHRPIIGELLHRNVVGEHCDRLCIQTHPSLLPPFCLRDVDHAVIGFDVARRDGEHLVDPHAGAPQHPRHEVVPPTALVRRLEHLVDLLLFKVVVMFFTIGILSAITVVVLNCF